jgi:hypothetical protein
MAGSDEKDPTGGDDHQDDNEDNDDDKETKGKLVPQSEVDRIVRERLARATKGQLTKEELAQLRDKATKFDELDAKSKSAEERLSAEAQANKTAAEKATERARSKALRASIAEACSALSIQDVAVVKALIADGEPVDYDDEDEPIGITDRVKDILKARPSLKNGRFDTGADGGPKPGDKEDYSDPEFLAKLSMDQWMEARAAGKIK